MTTNKPDDNFAWVERLGCPKTACTESTKKLLSKGILGLLWDDIADKLHPTSEVFEVRKNVLLYKLRENCKDDEIETVRKTLKIRAEREDMKRRIIDAEERQKRQEFSLRKKRQQLIKIKSERRAVKTKRDFFNTKYDEMRAQVQDCNQMRQVCNCLMPSVGEQVDQKTIEDSLTLVSSLSKGANKKQVWKKISETLYPVGTPILWNTLLHSRTLDTERVINLGSEISPNISSSNYAEKFEVGIAKACSLHVTAVSKRLLHDARANVRQQSIMEYIENIEKSLVNDLDISEWLELTLEVRKWEAEQIGLQKEVNEINDNLELRIQLNTELNNTASAMQGIDAQIVECAQDIQTSMALLKSSGTALNIVKEKLLGGLQKFSALRGINRDGSWLHIDLSNELDNFYDRIDMNALRKITLSGKVGGYRHATCCISQSALSIPEPLDMDSVHDFPFVRAPVYHLLDCYKALIKNNWIANDKPSTPMSDLKIDVCTELEEQWRSMSAKKSVNNFGELLDLVDHALENTQLELRAFDSTLEAWKDQKVSKVLIYDDQTVDGMTYKEWQQRYNALVLAIASKMKTLKQ